MKPRTPPGAQCGNASAQRCPSILVLIVAGTEDPRGRINPASAARGPLLFLLSSYCWGPSAHMIVFGRWLGPLPRRVLWSIISFCDPISHPSCTLLSCSPSRDPSSLLKHLVVPTTPSALLFCDLHNWCQEVKRWRQDQQRQTKFWGPSNEGTLQSQQWFWGYDCTRHVNDLR